MGDFAVTVDRSRFEGSFEGFDRPLAVRAPDGAMVSLGPWTYDSHIEALRDCVVLDEDGLLLDRIRFGQHVLRASGLDPSASAWLLPLALWWGAGGADAADTDEGAAPLDLGSARAWLQPWTEAARLAALGRCLRRNERAGDWFDAVGYLDAMVRASVVALDPPRAIGTLDSAAVARLLDAVLALNLHRPEHDPLLSDALPEQARRSTLALCAALGWTPAQVLAAPAVEIQRLIAMTGARRVAAPSAPATGLAAQPGAVVFRFEPDPP